MDITERGIALNINLLLQQLAGIYSDRDQASFESSQTMEKIRAILLDRTLKLEQRCNKLEVFLINLINTETNRSNHKKAKLALKIVLFNRGYTTDIPRKLERTLLLLPYEIISKRSWISELGGEFINKISHKISSCLDSKETGANRIQAALDLLRKLSEKFTGRQLVYINLCRDECRKHLLYSSRIEHSLWASASLESLTYLTYLNSPVAREKLGGTEGMKEREITEQTKLHLCRARYFVDQSKERLEDIGDYVDRKLAQFAPPDKEPALKPRRPGSMLSKVLQAPVHNDLIRLKLEYAATHHPIIQTHRDLFIEAHHLILNRNNNPQGIARALDLAYLLKKNKNPLGTFIKLVTLTLSSHITKERWNHYWTRLHQTVIPMQWRVQVCQLWLTLADHFTENQDEEHPYYSACASSCISHITEKWGKEAHLMAKIKITQITQNKTLLRVLGDLERELEAYRRQIAGTEGESTEFDYPLENQFALVEYLTQVDATHSPTKSGSRQKIPDHNEPTAEQLSEIRVKTFKNLLVEEYAPGLEIVCKLLSNNNAPDHAHARQAVQEVFGIRYTNPLKLCEKLRKQGCNSYLMLWGPIYANAVENGFLPELIAEWGRLKLSPTYIDNKLLTYLRSLIDSAIHDNETVAPFREDYLEEIDMRLIRINLQLSNEIRADTTSTLFCSALLHAGQLEGYLADLAWRENNIPLQEQLAKRSIDTATRSIATPKPVTPSAELPQKVADTSTSPRARSKTLSTSNTIRPSGNTTPTTPKGKKDSIPESLPPTNSEASASGNKMSSLKLGARRAPPSLREAFISAESPPSSTSPNLPSSPRGLNSSESSSATLTARRSPSYLGFFHLALSTWSLHLKDQPNRQANHLETFHSNLNTAREAPIKQERCYIMAQIWLEYFNSKRDKAWITVEELQKLEKKVADFSEIEYDVTLQTTENVYDFFIIRKVKHYLERAMDDNMFPLASFTYSKEIYYWMTQYYDHDKEKLKVFLLKCIRYLEIAIETHGYLPSLYNYALIVKSNLDLFRSQGCISDLLEKIMLYLRASERFVYIDPGQMQELHESIETVRGIERSVAEFVQILNGEKTPPVPDHIANPIPLLDHIVSFIDNNADLAQARLINTSFCRSASTLFRVRTESETYPLETPRVLDSLSADQMACCFHLNKLPVTISYKIGSMEAPVFGFQIQCASVDQLISLNDYFCRTEKLYRYTKKVRFLQPLIILNPAENSLLVTHSDIAILGLLRLYQASRNQPKRKSQETELQPLFNVLRAASELPEETWQWKGTTFTRLNDIIREYDVQASKNAIMLSPLNRLLSEIHSHSGKNSTKPSSVVSSSRNSVQLSPRNEPAPQLLDLARIATTPRRKLSDDDLLPFPDNNAIAAPPSPPLPTLIEREETSLTVKPLDLSGTKEFSPRTSQRSATPPAVRSLDFSGMRELSPRITYTAPVAQDSPLHASSSSSSVPQIGKRSSTITKKNLAGSSSVTSIPKTLNK